jgi:hypothetical protein
VTRRKARSWPPFTAPTNLCPAGIEFQDSLNGKPVTCGIPTRASRGVRAHEVGYSQSTLCYMLNQLNWRPTRDWGTAPSFLPIEGNLIRMFDRSQQKQKKTTRGEKQNKKSSGIGTSVGFSGRDTNGRGAGLLNISIGFTLLFSTRFVSWEFKQLFGIQIYRHSSTSLFIPGPLRAIEAATSILLVNPPIHHRGPGRSDTPRNTSGKEQESRHRRQQE